MKKREKLIDDALFVSSQPEPNSITKEIADMLAETRE